MTKKEYRHEEPPNPHGTGTGLPNSLGVLFMALFWGVIFLIGLIFTSLCSGCTSYGGLRTNTLGGGYAVQHQSNPFSRTTTEAVIAPGSENVQGAMLSDALRLCLAQRERQAELAVRRDSTRSGQGGGFVAVVPPQHPSTVTDDHAYCMSLVQGQGAGSALGQSVVPVPPTVVQNPWFGGWGMGQPFVPFSGTGGAPGVR